MTYTQRGKQTIDTTREVPDVGLNKDFKRDTLNTFKELKKTVSKESKESMITTFHGIENINKEMEMVTKKMSKTSKI